jgi:hypothetical protein
MLPLGDGDRQYWMVGSKKEWNKQDFPSFVLTRPSWTLPLGAEAKPKWCNFATDVGAEVMYPIAGTPRKPSLLIPVSP